MRKAADIDPQIAEQNCGTYNELHQILAGMHSLMRRNLVTRIPQQSCSSSHKILHCWTTARHMFRLFWYMLSNIPTTRKRKRSPSHRATEAINQRLRTFILYLSRRNSTPIWACLSRLQPAPSPNQRTKSPNTCKSLLRPAGAEM